MKSLHHVKLKVKANKSGCKYVHVKALGDYFCPICGKKMIICGSKRRWYKVYLNRTHEDNAWDIIELNLTAEEGIDWYRDSDEVTYELILFTIPVFLCRDCQASQKDHPQHYHRGIVEDMMQTRLWYTIKAMCDTASGEEMPAELCSDGNDIFQTIRMIRRIVSFGFNAHISKQKYLKIPKKTDTAGRREVIRVIRETVSARMKNFYK